MTATVLGDERYDDRLEDPSAEGRDDERRWLGSMIDEARSIDPDGLDQEDRITLDMLQVLGRIRLRAFEHRTYHFEAVDAMAGPHNIPGDIARFQRVDTPERFDGWCYGSGRSPPTSMRTA